MSADERISVELRGSPGLKIVVAAAHVFAAVVVVVTFASSWISLAGILLLAVSALLTLPRVGKNLAGSKFSLAADCSCRLQPDGEAGSRSIEGRLRPDTTALPGLIILRFEQSGTRVVHSLVLLRGALDSDDWRRLQVFLRWGVRFDAAAPTPWVGPS
jgi:toxin CptA